MLSPDRPLLCVVTDRRRFGSDERVRERTLLRQVAAAAEAGIELVQIRERDLQAAALQRLVAEAVSITRHSRTRIIVNDRIDVALSAGADGAHLRADGPESQRVRMMVPEGFLVGRSVHSVEEAEREGGTAAVDYLLFGTMFPTSSKPGLDPVGTNEALATAARVARVPVLAIGGMTARTIGRVAKTGAAGVAAIGYFAPEATDIDAVLSLVDAAAEARRLFDTSGSVI